MNDALDILRFLNARITPSPKQRHSITLRDDAVGLSICICSNGRFYEFYLDMDDLEKKPEDVVDEIVVMFEKILKEECVGVVG